MARPAACRRFTLIELLVVVGIIAVLAALLLPALSTARTRAKFGRWQATTSQLKSDDAALVYYDFQPENFDGRNGGKLYNLAAGLGTDNYNPDDYHATVVSALGYGTSKGRWPGIKGGVDFLGTGGAAYLTAAKFVWKAATTTNPQPITIMFWQLKTTSIQTNSTFFSMQNPTSDNARCQAHAPASDNKIYWDYGDAYQAQYRPSADYTPYLNKWTHVALVSTGKGGTRQEIYLNGKKVASSTASDAPFTALGALNFGNWVRVGYKYDGRADEFALLNRALSPLEIEAHYRNGVP